MLMGVERKRENGVNGGCSTRCAEQKVAEDGTEEKDWGVRRLLYTYVDP